MNPKLILILETESLLIEGVVSILENNSNFVVISRNPKDLTELIGDIEQFQPDVIIMDEDTYLVEPVQLFASLRNISNVRLIVLNNRRILVDIYEKYEHFIPDPSQLVEAIALDLRFIHAE